MAAEISLDMLECVDSYQVKERPDEGIDILIRVPKRFRDLWIVKLDALKTTDEEITAYEPEEQFG